MTTCSPTIRTNARYLLCLLVISIPRIGVAQEGASTAEILARLDRLEDQNRALKEQVQELRNEVAVLKGQPASASPEEPTLDERMSVVENQIEEQSQTKVEASQRFPIRLTGMALMNAFSNSAHGGGRDNPTMASLDTGPRRAGGSIRQSVIGFEFRGPALPGGGSVNGSLFMDFYGYAGDSYGDHFRVRTGRINFDWKNTSFMIGQDKPLVSPREPNSLAQVGVSPLTNSGNLWLWQPQARLERRFTLGEGTTFRAQTSVYQLREEAAIVPPEYANSLERTRPALEGRFELGHQRPDGFRVEIAPGFHVATSHVAGDSVPSRMVTVDWFLKPAARFEFTGMLFSGKNIAGLGALRQGFRIVAPGHAEPVRSWGGWSQFTYLATRRVTLNLFGGQQDDRNSDLPVGGFGKNQAYGGNVMLRLAPNVVLSLENLRTWTSYVGIGNRHNSHYDLAIAYLF